MKLSAFVLFLLLCLPLRQICAQESKTIRDFGTWTSLTLDYKFSKKWKTSLTQDIRTFSNASKIDKAITDLDALYKINKAFRIGAGLRYAYARNRKLLLNRNLRYNLDLKYKRKLAKKWAIDYRFRFQNNFENPFTGLSDYSQKIKARNRLKIEYEKAKHLIYFSTELFREYVYYKRPSYDRMRFVIGNEMKSIGGEFNYALVYERQLEDDHPFNRFFIKLNYTFKLKRG